MGRPGKGGPSTDEAFIITAVLVHVSCQSLPHQFELGSKHVDGYPLFQGDKAGMLLAATNETAGTVEEDLMEDICPKACSTE